jgi:hypothetical protein
MFITPEGIGADGQRHVPVDTSTPERWFVRSSMSNPQAKGSSAARWPECACGLTFKDPWQLTAHFLEVCPPHARKSPDGGQHADATRLGVKLDTGSPAAWEVVTWASDERSDLRVAASIAHRVKSGDLKRFDTILRQDIREACQVSLRVVGDAIGILKDHGVIRSFGGRNSVVCDDIDEAIGGPVSHGHLLHTIVRHVSKLEDEVSALRTLQRPSPVREAGTS